jgi:hypothetical protein
LELNSLKKFLLRIGRKHSNRMEKLLQRKVQKSSSDAIHEQKVYICSKIRLLDMILCPEL